MKRLLLGLFFSIVNTVNAQTNYINLCDCWNSNRFEFYFNPPFDSSSNYISFDTTQVNNIWQIGVVTKNIFTAGYGGPGALVTDTINPYPVNNRSSFQFTFINCAFDDSGFANCGGNYYGATIDMYHRIESESGRDGGMIEVSHNNGRSWLDVIHDTITFAGFYNGPPYYQNDTVASLGRPGVSGSRNWSHITLDYLPSWVSNTNDTITLRFTFASDSVQTNQDGWMFGYIKAFATFPGIREIQNDNLISIYPNPATDVILIDYNIASEESSLKVYDFTGKTVMENPHFNENKINVDKFNNGIYLMKFTIGNNFALKRFVVQK